VKISGYMYKFQDLTPISGQISKFQEFQDNAQAWTVQTACYIITIH